MTARHDASGRLRAGADVLRALPVVLVIRILLWVLPFATWRQLFARALAGLPRSDAAAGHAASGPRVARAVSRAARLVPGASCLTQALAARFLLARAGEFARLRLGVARGARGSLHAHAWLETSQGTLDVSAAGGAFAPLAVPDDSTPGPPDGIAVPARGRRTLTHRRHATG